MTRRIFSLRRKPVGWRGDHYRHYLAAKGISTKKYFANGAVATRDLGLNPTESFSMGNDFQATNTSMDFGNVGPNDALKGNRSRTEDPQTGESKSPLHAAYAKGWSQADVMARRNESRDAALAYKELMELKDRMKEKRAARRVANFDPDATEFQATEQARMLVTGINSPEPAINYEQDFTQEQYAPEPELPMNTVTNEPATMALIDKDVDKLPQSEIIETQDQVTTPGVVEDTTDSFELNRSGTTNL